MTFNEDVLIFPNLHVIRFITRYICIMLMIGMTALAGLGLALLGQVSSG